MRRAADPPAELERLLRQVVLSLALRNADLHAKNLSLFNDDGLVSLTPVYDLVTTTAFVPEQTHLGLSIGGKFKLIEIRAEKLVEEARSWGIPELRARAIVLEVASDLAAAMQKASDEFPDVDRVVRDHAFAGVFAVAQPRPGRGSYPRLRSASRPNGRTAADARPEETPADS